MALAPAFLCYGAGFLGCFGQLSDPCEPRADACARFSQHLALSGPRPADSPYCKRTTHRLLLPRADRPGKGRRCSRRVEESGDVSSKQASRRSFYRARVYVSLRLCLVAVACAVTGALWAVLPAQRLACGSPRAGGGGGAARSRPHAPPRSASSTSRRAGMDGVAPRRLAEMAAVCAASRLLPAGGG